MCRFHCTDPSTCKIARFTVQTVKEEPSQFVRNRSVQFFSPPSDSEDSDCEDFSTSSKAFQSRSSLASANPQFVTESQHANESTPVSLSLSAQCASTGSSDSGFLDGKEQAESDDSGVSSAQSTAFSLKSILALPKEEGQQRMANKRVRFADDCGHCLVRTRSIQSRRIDALFEDLVEIGPVEEDKTWRAALLLKLFQQQASEAIGNETSRMNTTGVHTTPEFA